MGDVRPSLVVEGVSKRFRLAAAQRGDLRERFAWRSRREARPAADFWALDDVGFTVEPGHPLGIVGHNGSGKSTLLKLLTGILAPTRGRIEVRGRVGALIEVGAGFHPDLSGRENVYLNGSLLGLSRRQVQQRFDRIVAFAGLERFIDTPVKRYSSGMYMRLGFSLVAHLDPEILLIDEVLAVGDQQFQSRCLRFLKDFVARGGSLVFVSHAMLQVAELCERCVWLDRGRVRYLGATQTAIDQYLAVAAEREDAEFERLYPDEWAARERQTAEARRRAEAEEREREAAAAAARAEAEERERTWRAWWNRPDKGRLLGARLLDEKGEEAQTLPAGRPATLLLSYRLDRPLPKPAFTLDFFRASDGLHLFTTSNYDHGVELPGECGPGELAIRIGMLSLNEGEYRVRLSLYSSWREEDWESALEDRIDEALRFRVSAGRFAHGCAFIPVTWPAPERAS